MQYGGYKVSRWETSYCTSSLCWASPDQNGHRPGHPCTGTEGVRQSSNPHFSPREASTSTERRGPEQAGSPFTPPEPPTSGSSQCPAVSGSRENLVERRGLLSREPSVGGGVAASWRQGPAAPTPPPPWLLPFLSKGFENRTPAQYQRNSALDLSVEDEEEYNKKTQKWDEMNILATYHPEGKDYGLMKIDEPSTPYNRIVGGDDDEAAMSDSESNVNVTAEILAQKLSAAEGINPKIFEPKEETSEEEEEEELTPEEQENKKQFEMKRKMHYNEGMNIKLARQLIAKELEDAEDEDDSKSPEELENFEDDTDEELSENENPES